MAKAEKQFKGQMKSDKGELVMGACGGLLACDAFCAEGGCGAPAVVYSLVHEGVIGGIIARQRGTAHGLIQVTPATVESVP